MSIIIAHLEKRFGTRTVLKDLNLQVDGPLVLMGPSGCGKTTLLRILMGLENADGGTVTGVGTIGAVFQENRLCPQLTAVGNIVLTGGDSGTAERELRALGFGDKDLALPSIRLSGGKSAVRHCCGRCCAHRRRRFCWTNRSPVWMPNWWHRLPWPSAA